MRKIKFMKKRMVASLLAIGLISSNMFNYNVPLTVHAAQTAKTLQVGETVKFDFGSKNEVEEGYIGVDATKAYYTDGYSILNTDGETGYTYGFIGIGANGYKASGRTDSYQMESGMEITLKNGGSGTKATRDYVYAEQTIYNQLEAAMESEYDKGDAKIPVRFAMNVDQTSYYTVKATIANASDTENAIVDLYSEKRHQIATNVELAPGETKEITFNVAVTDVYYTKSEPKEKYKDTQLNIVVIGENAALATLEVTRIEHKPTIFICSDSTGCDQYGNMPAYPLQNYAGVGQGLSAYFQDIMISNQGEGGLASQDNFHLNTGKAQLQKGDYLYVQYGHNEKSEANYVSNLAKYYTAAHDNGAKLILVGPIERSKKNQYDSSSNTWSSSLGSYSAAAKDYVTCLIYGGTEAAAAYTEAWNSTDVYDDAKAAADAYVKKLTAAGITSAGVTDVAFIDLNARWIDFLASVSAGNSKVGKNKYALTNYYYTFNHLGAKDTTHINDYGANQAGYIFATEVKKTYEAGINKAKTTSEYIQAKVLEDLYNDYTKNRASVTAATVSNETILAGAAPNSCYPQKFALGESQYSTETVITDVKVKNGVFSTVDVYIANTMSSYGKVAVKVYDSNNKLLGTVWTTDWLDNTSMTAGSSATLTFETTDIEIPSEGKYVAEVYPVDDATHEYDGESASISNSYTVELSGNGDSDISDYKNLKFDFGDRDVQEGYISITSDNIYSEDIGYGFTTSVQEGMKRVPSEVAEEYTNLHADQIHASDYTDMQFDVDLANGIYLVTVHYGCSSINYGTIPSLTV